MATEPVAQDPTADPLRRSVLRGVAVGTVGLPLLAACAQDEGEPTTATPETDTPTPTGEASATEETDAPAGTLASTSEVPVGGGVVLTDKKVVLTQPTKGEFLAFTAVCTHQGCVVSSVSDGTITCGCHGSQYSAEDGSVTTGPATSPLAEIEISVSGEQITRA